MKQELIMVRFGELGTKGKNKQKPIFSPRMAHSAYELDEFPNGYLQRLAKDGVDAILVFTRGVNKPGNPAVEYFDYNDLIDRAESYGIDVYAYSYLENFNSPFEENAEEIYESIYAPVFKVHNKLKGIVFVGESVQFPSRDKRTTGRVHTEFLNKDNFPD